MPGSVREGRAQPGAGGRCGALSAEAACPAHVPLGWRAVLSPAQLSQPGPNRSQAELSSEYRQPESNPQGVTFSPG